MTFKVEVLALLPDNENPIPEFPSLSNIGINTQKLGLTDADLTGLSEAIIGMDTSDRIIGSNGRDLIAGLKGNDRLFGAGGGDLLIGGKGRNRYLYSGLSDSLDRDGQRDKIIAFGKRDRINLRPLRDRVSSAISVPTTSAAPQAKYGSKRKRSVLTSMETRQLI